jgi:hypothetical protein
MNDWMEGLRKKHLNLLDCDSMVWKFGNERFELQFIADNRMH